MSERQWAYCTGLALGAFTILSLWRPVSELLGETPNANNSLLQVRPGRHLGVLS